MIINMIGAYIVKGSWPTVNLAQINIDVISVHKDTLLQRERMEDVNNALISAALALTLIPVNNVQKDSNFGQMESATFHINTVEIDHLDWHMPTLLIIIIMMQVR